MLLALLETKCLVIAYLETRSTQLQECKLTDFVCSAAKFTLAGRGNSLESCTFAVFDILHSVRYDHKDLEKDRKQLVSAL